MPRIVNNKGSLWHWCGGCAGFHRVPVVPATLRWDWNGSMAAATLRPSVKHTMGRGERICHYHITEGRIEYCGDCTHALAGQVVELPEFPLESLARLFHPEDFAPEANP